MKNRTTFYLLAYALIMFANVVYSQWSKTLDGSMNCLAVSGTNTFVGTRNGIYLSADHGSTWTAVNNGLPISEPQGVFIRSIAIIDTNIFASTTDYGIYLSTDNGTNWSVLNSTLSVLSFAVSGTNLFAACGSSGVFLSIDNGKNWSNVSAGISGSVRKLAASGANLYAGTNNAGIFLSTDQGASWAAINNGLTSLGVDAITTMGTSLFAGTGSDGVFRSTNNGASWTAANSGLTSLYAYSFAVHDHTLFSGSYEDGVFVSTNDGANWTAVNTNIAEDYNHLLTINDLVVSGTNLIAATNLMGVWKISLNGTNFIITPDSIAFGSTSIGDSVVYSATVSNILSVNPLSISNVTSSGDYHVYPNPSATFPIMIEPSSSYMFSISFKPGSPGFSQKNITFTHNGIGDSTSIIVSGTGVSSTDWAQFKIPINVTIDSAGIKDWSDQNNYSFHLQIGVSGDGPGGTILDNSYSPDIGTEYGSFGNWREGIMPPDYCGAVFFDFRSQKTWPSTGVLAGYDFRGFNNIHQVDTFAILVVMNSPFCYSPDQSGITFSWNKALVGLCADQCVLLKRTGSNIYTQVADMKATSRYCDYDEVNGVAGRYYIIKTGAHQPPAVAFAADLDSLSFGNVPEGQSATLPITVYNSGTLVNLAGSLSVSGPFSTNGILHLLLRDQPSIVILCLPRTRVRTTFRFPAEALGLPSS
jgi:hypothetical protein